MNDWFLKLTESLLADSSTILLKVISILLIILVGKVCLSFISKMTAFQIKKAEALPEEQSRRIQTMMTLVRSICRYGIAFITILMILAQLGFGNAINNLLVTAGIGSLALGIGAQSLVKDVATGFFMLFEKQFSVGDYVKLGDYEGTVTAIAMRVTYLKNYTGQQIIIPNGSISHVINYSRSDSLARVVVGIPYEIDTRSAIEWIQEAANCITDTMSEIVTSKPEVVGVTNFANHGVEITVTCKTKPASHWQIERGLRLAIKERLEQENIVLPYPQQGIRIVSNSNQDHSASIEK